MPSSRLLKDTRPTFDPAGNEVVPLSLSCQLIYAAELVFRPIGWTVKWVSSTYVRETDIPVGGNGRILSSDSGRAHVKSWHSRKGKTSALARNSAEIERCMYPCVSHNFGPVLNMTHPRLSQDQTLRLIGSEKIWER